MEDEIALARLAQWGPYGMARYAPRDPEVWAWVMDRTQGLPETATPSERLWCAINGQGSRPACDLGSERLFNTLSLGYREFCGKRSACECSRRKQSELAKSLRDAGKFAMTWKESIRDPEASRAKGRRTSEERHGGIGLGSPKIAEKIRATVVERYGVDHYMRSSEAPVSDMSAARAEAERLYGGNPFVVFRDRARRTMLERYGVENPQQSEAIRAKTRETCLRRYGETTHLRDPEIAAAATQKRRIAAMGPEAVAFLDDPAAVRAAIDSGLSARQVSELHGMSYVTALRAMAREGHVPEGRSHGEDEVASFVAGLGFAVERNRRVLVPDLFPPKRRPRGALELDVLVSGKMLAIEYCGLFPHSVGGSAAYGGRVIGPHYHLDKLVAAEALGYRLITIFSDEWQERPAAVRARIAAALGVAERGKGGRHLSVRRTSFSEVRGFLDANHLQGSGPPTGDSYAAFEGDALVGCMTFVKGRAALNSSGKSPELARFCGDGMVRPGMASKLLAAYARDSGAGELVSYADRRWSQGNVYRALGFEPAGASSPGYWYTDDYRTRRHRYSYRKDVLVGMGGDPSKTEAELAEERGLDRIYDCGTLKFVRRMG